ncbi:MAG: ATP-binding protein [Candidatus Omnitrophica bacterium]|nr:ATP-binding protein [Candidatus Omnitrophota bacterium]
MNINFKEKKLLLAFAFLILLTLLIGLFGIAQIQGLSRKIEDLGRHNLKRQSAVLEMRINNAIYAAGIRNYVFWRAFRYLRAMPMAVNVDKVFAVGVNFKNQLKIYRQSIYLGQEKEWADQVTVSFDEVFALGKKIIQSADQEESGKISQATNNLLMSFEDRIYKIDEFLNNFMGKSNLEDVERQLSLAKADKQQAVFFLKINLISALVAGISIAFSVYRRRAQERAYRQQIFNRMINIEENERKNLSTAVHDEMGQDLSALKIYLGLIAQGLSEIALSPAVPDTPGVIANPPKAGETISLKAKVEECKKIAAGLINKSHNIAFLLRPPDLDEVGLLESLESLLLESSHLSGIEYVFQKPAGSLELVPEYSLLIYRIVQELLTNMIKYAKAKNVEVSINKKANSVELFYRDDGQGFDYNQDAGKFLRRKEDKFRLGLIGLKERVEVLDGSMQINSSRGKGMSIAVTLPIIWP